MILHYLVIHIIRHKTNHFFMGANITRHIVLEHANDMDAFLAIRLGDRLAAQQSAFFGAIPVKLDRPLRNKSILN